MLIKEEKGLTGIDIAISLIIITIFISTIANLIANVNLNSKSMERKSIATSYAVQEIEKITAQGYKIDYNDKGITEEQVVKEEDIYKNSEFTGYHKTVTIKDYVLIVNDSTKQKNVVKQITTNISYKLGKENQNVTISTYVAK